MAIRVTVPEPPAQVVAERVGPLPSRPPDPVPEVAAVL